MMGIGGQAQGDRPNGHIAQAQTQPRYGLAQPHRLTHLALVVVASLCLAGCGLVGSSETITSEAMPNQFVERSVRGNSLVSKTLPVSLRLRRGWRPAPANTLHNSADLQAYNPDQQIFLLVLGESTANVPPGSLEEQANRYLMMLKSGFTQVLANENRTQTERISSFPAVQYELRGEVFGKSVAYLHTTIQMDNHYYQVVVWTPDSLFAANASEMRAIVEQFGPDQS